MTTQEFIFDAPLFCKVAGEEADVILKDLKGYLGFKVDGFNAQKGVESTYTISSELNCRSNIGAFYANSVKHSLFEYTEPWYVTLKCGRYEDYACGKFGKALYYESWAISDYRRYS